VDDDGYHRNTEDRTDDDVVVVEFEEGRGGFRVGSTISFVESTKPKDRRTMWTVVIDSDFDDRQCVCVCDYITGN
jgi:hypothetical protein